MPTPIAAAVAGRTDGRRLRVQARRDQCLAVMGISRWTLRGTSSSSEDAPSESDKPVSKDAWLDDAIDA